MASAYGYQGEVNDQLFDSDYAHIGGDTCHDCDRKRVRHRSERVDSKVKVHYGKIASTPAIVKDGVLRDQIAKQAGIKFLETEAVGISKAISYGVIRGVCDYADSHQTSLWQRHAAATAAAYVKTLLLALEPSEFTTLKAISESLIIWGQQFIVWPME